MSARTRLSWMIAVPVVVAVLTLNIVNSRRAQATQEEAYGRFTKQQILDKAEGLCQVFARETPVRYLLAQRMKLYHPGGKPRHCWMVDVTDQANRHIAELDFDADTGDLWNVGHADYSLRGAAARPLSRQRAALAAVAWLRNLGIAEKESEWRLDGAPEFLRDVWEVSTRTSGRAATVKLDAFTGNLILVHSRRLRSSEGLSGSESI